MSPKPSIALLLGSHHDEPEEEHDEHEDGDDEDHGVNATEEFCKAVDKGDYHAAWDAFKTMQSLADEDEDGEEHEDGEE